MAKKGPHKYKLVGGAVYVSSEYLMLNLKILATNFHLHSSSHQLRNSENLFSTPLIVIHVDVNFSKSWNKYLLENMGATSHSVTDNVIN